jgi:hypothetical protein
MIVTISQQAYWKLFDENVSNIDKIDPDDDLDIIWKYPTQIGEGYLRIIELRSGLELGISNYHLHDNVILQASEREHSLEYSFYLSGHHRDKFLNISAGEYGFYGSGIAPKEHCEMSAAQQLVEINVHIKPEIFRSFIGDKSGQLPPELQHLVTNRTYHSNSGLQKIRQNGTAFF